MFSLEHAVAHLATINPTGINGCQISSMMNIVSEHANDSDKFLSMIFVIFWFEILSSSVIQYLQWYILFHWSVKEITMIFLSGIKQGHFFNELGCMRIFYIVCYFYLFSITHKHNKLDFLNSYQVNNHTNYRYIMYKSHHSWSLQIL